MNLLIDILLALLILGALAALALVPFALSRLYIIWGRMVNNTFMIVLFNGGLWAIRMKSETASFRGGDDPVKRWDVREGYPDPENNAGALPLIGWIPVLFAAHRVIIPINFIDVIRPKKDKEGGRYIYNLIPQEIRTRTPPRIIVHGFETTPVETRGHDQKHDGKNPEQFEDGNLVALVTEVLQVTMEIENPYLAFVRITEEGIQAGQKFMSNVNGTLQSVAREVTAMFTYNELIRARVEDSSSDQTPEEKEKRKRIRVRFGKIFKRLANRNLKAYGVKIRDVDMLDHSLDPVMADYLQKPQKAAYEARETVIKATAKKQEKVLLAEGDAAELAQLLLLAKNDLEREIVREEIRRRGKQRAAETVGKKFNGDYLSVNFGADGNNAPQPAVLVGGPVGYKTKPQTQE